MVMELIRATSRKGGFSFYRGGDIITYSEAPFSPMNHCSLFLNSTLKVVNDP